MLIELMVMTVIVELTRYLTDWWTPADVNAQTFRGKNRSPLRAKPPNQLLPLSIVILAYEEAEPVWLAQIEKYSLFNENIIVGTIGNIFVVISTERALRRRLFDDCLITGATFISDDLVYKLIIIIIIIISLNIFTGHSSMALPQVTSPQASTWVAAFGITHLVFCFCR